MGIAMQRLSEINLESFIGLDRAAPFRTDFERIERYLKNEVFVKSKLDDLEREMWLELERRDIPLLQQIRDVPITGRQDGLKKYFSTSPKSEFLIDPARRKRSVYKGLLSAVLRRTEQDNGFGEVSYAWGIGSEPFLNNLRARRPLKDYSADIDTHGEYTHRIQWWIVCNHIQYPSHRNAELYAQCAAFSNTFDTRIGPTSEDNRNSNNDQPRNDGRCLYLWDYLFDSATNTTGVHPVIAGGTSPINVFRWCREDRYPLLSAFLKYRVAKATYFHWDMLGAAESHDTAVELAGNDIPAGVLERAARRFRGKPYVALSLADRDAVLEITKRGFTDRGE